MVAKKKNTEGMAFIVSALKRNRAAKYADIKARADKKRLTIYPIMYGRAQAWLGIVKSAKRGTGRYAQANRRGPGRPSQTIVLPTPNRSLDSIVEVVKQAQQERQRYRAALGRIQGVLADLLP